MKQDKHKILLIEPPFYRLYKDTYSLNRYPLSLGYLAGTILKETDWSVMSYNADFFYQSESISLDYLTGQGFENYLNNLKDITGKVWKEIEATIVEYKPTVVGVSTKSQNFMSAYLVAKKVKEVDKNIIVIMGGPHPSMVGKDILLKYSEVDLCVKGEGENTIVEVLEAIKNSEDFQDIKGVIYRKNGYIVENAPRDLMIDLDTLCFPHENAPETLKDYEKYPKDAFRNIFAIRGCPFNCFFCGSRQIWTRRARKRSVENVIEEIKSLREKGVSSIHFDDDTFGVSKEYMFELCNAIILNCRGLMWSCELHVKLVDEETVALLKKAGCVHIQVGLESGNNAILKKIRKNFTVEEALRKCAIIKKYGIKLEVFFMIGFPWETPETLRDTMLAIKRIRCDHLTYSIFTPYPGTEAFDFCKQEGLIGEDFDCSLYNHKSPRNCFCLHISPEKFRKLASEVEKTVDRANLHNKIRRFFSLKSYRMIRELGVVKSIKKGLECFFKYQQFLLS